jgi:hypothetical protein
VKAKRVLKTPFEIVDATVPEAPLFWRLNAELEAGTGYDRRFWKDQIAEGRIQVLQRGNRTPGSPIVIPRAEIVRVLTEMVRTPKGES